jgi:GTP-binding protein Era
MSFKSGFVNIIGKPNVGKSTLINGLINEKISIVSPKVQTTRHRIMGIVNGENYQVVFSDTPGIINDKKYELHHSMMKFVQAAVEDADVVFYMVDPKENPHINQPFLSKLISQNIPIFLILNKIDLITQEETMELISAWSEIIPKDNIFPISAIKGFNLQLLLQSAIQNVPENPPYFPEDQLTDKTERFLASEVIREKIFLKYRQEIPYSTEVIVVSFKEEEKIIRISAEIIVERQSQKGILIGKGGESLKRVGTDARNEMEEMFQKKVFLELFVKVRENWRENKGFLRQFGFDA